MRWLLVSRARPLLVSPFARVVGGMMAYTAIGHGLNVLAAPFIGRLYAADQIGLYGLFVTIAATAAAFVALLYDLAIPAADTDEQARELTVGAMFFAFWLSSAVGAGMALCSLFGLLGMDQLPAWAGVLMAVILLLQVIIQLAQAWRIRQQEALAIGRSNVTLNIGRSSTQVLIGALIPAWWALALGELAGRAGCLGNLLPRHWRWRDLRLPPASHVTRTLHRYREFPTVLMPAQILDAVANLGQASGLTMLFGPAALGQYFLMRRTLDLPTAFAFRSLSDVFYARLAGYTRSSPERVRPFFIKAFVLLCAAGLIGGSPLFFFAPELFRIVFGPGWETAGSLASVMLPAMVLNLAVAPVSRVFALTTKPWLRYVNGLINTIGTLATMIAAWQFSWTLWQTTAGISAAIALSYCAYFLSGCHASTHLRPIPPGELRAAGTD
jgi:O-antigen/teichoic acid export membrane protein